MQSDNEAMAAIALEPLLAVPAVAQDCGSFYGYTLRVKPIGGAQYGPL